jgi:hypothetical protein
LGTLSALTIQAPTWAANCLTLRSSTSADTDHTGIQFVNAGTNTADIYTDETGNWSVTTDHNIYLKTGSAGISGGTARLTVFAAGGTQIHGALTQTGVATFAARPVFSASITVQNGGQIGSAGDLDAIAIASNGVVTFSQIPVMPANSIDSDEYIDGSIDREHLAADIIDGTKIADDVINSEHYVDGSIDRAHLAADIIDGTKIADDAINSEHYAAGSIDAEHMAANSIDSDAYVDGSIDDVHIASTPTVAAGNNTIVKRHASGYVFANYFNTTANDVSSGVTKVMVETGNDNYIRHGTAEAVKTFLGSAAANSIDSDAYVDGSIDRAHLAADIIDGTKIANDAINSEHYAADSIDEEHIANDAVGSAELKTLSTLLIKNSAGTTLKTLMVRVHKYE